MDNTICSDHQREYVHNCEECDMARETDSFRKGYAAGMEAAAKICDANAISFRKGYAAGMEAAAKTCDANAMYMFAADAKTEEAGEAPEVIWSSTLRRAHQAAADAVEIRAAATNARPSNSAGDNNGDLT